MEQASRKSYKVGQTIFIVAPSKNSVVPAKVIAKHTTELEAGIVVKHTCQTENDPQAEATFELESLYKRDSSIICFDVLEEAESLLLNSATQKVRHLISEVRKKIAHPFYGGQARSLQQDQKESEVEETHAVMVLEDGTRVRVPRNLMSEA